VPVRFALALAAFAFPAAVPSAAADGGWAGEIVLARYAECGRHPAYPLDGGRRVVFDPTHLTFLVRRDFGSYVQVRYRGRDVLVAKWLFVLPDDAIGYATARLKARPDDPEASHFRALAYQISGDYKAALRDADRAIRSVTNSSRFYLTRALIYTAREEYEPAVLDFGKAIAFSPADPELFLGRGLLWAAKKDFTLAHRDFTEAVRLAPRDAEPLVYRAAVARRTGRYDACRFDLEAALRLDEGNPFLLAEKAWLLATCPDDKVRDGKQAVELAIRACRATKWKSGRTLIALAVAQAEVGKFEKAENCVEAAVQDAGWRANNGRLAEELMFLFDRDEPFREEAVKK
jgi:tetratricopeptide (TPR) repeat protein